MSSTAPAFVLDPREFRVLEGLRLAPRKSFTGRVRGERLTTKKGISIEFADYREYAEGDDLRHLDWNVLARLGTPVTKTYRDEEDLAVHLLLDCSSSMDFGSPTKLDYAVRLCCAFGFVGLTSGDAVYPRFLGKREQPMPALRGRSSYPRLAGWASGASADGQVDLATSIRSFLNSNARPGLTIVLSDGLSEEAPALARAIGGRGHDLMWAHILSDIELDPDLEGDLRLLDAEGGNPVEITANSYALREYKQRLQAHLNALAESVRRAGGRYTLLRPDQPLEAVVRDVFKREGWFAA